MQSSAPSFSTIPSYYQSVTPFVTAKISSRRITTAKHHDGHDVHPDGYRPVYLPGGSSHLPHDYRGGYGAIPVHPDGYRPVYLPGGSSHLPHDYRGGYGAIPVHPDGTLPDCDLVGSSKSIVTVSLGVIRLVNGPLS